MGMVDGDRTRGRPPRRWIDDIIDWCGCTLPVAVHLTVNTMEREDWRCCCWPRRPIWAMSAWMDGILSQVFLHFWSMMSCHWVCLRVCTNWTYSYIICYFLLNTCIRCLTGLSMVLEFLKCSKPSWMSWNSKVSWKLSICREISKWLSISDFRLGFKLTKNHTITQIGKKNNGALNRTLLGSLQCSPISPSWKKLGLMQYWDCYVIISNILRILHSYHA